MIVVNKIDTVSDAECEATVDALRRRLGAAAADVPILTTSALDGRGLEALSALACDGATVALSGPSGVGKSSLVNRLAGADVVPVAPLSPDGRGRHTTVRRQLVPVGGPTGGTLVDTPGLQDLIPWAGELSRVAESGGKLDRGRARGREPGRTSAPGGEQRRPVGATGAGGLAMAFRDIAAFAQHCRFQRLRSHGRAWLCRRRGCRRRRTRTRAPEHLPRTRVRHGGRNVVRRVVPGAEASRGGASGRRSSGMPPRRLLTELAAAGCHGHTDGLAATISGVH